MYPRFLAKVSQSPFPCSVLSVRVRVPSLRVPSPRVRIPEFPVPESEFPVPELASSTIPSDVFCTGADLEDAGHVRGDRLEATIAFFFFAVILLWSLVCLEILEARLDLAISSLGGRRLIH